MLESVILEYPRVVARMALPQSSSILELFWGLSSMDEEERITSAQKLVLGVKNLEVCQFVCLNVSTESRA